MRKLAFVILAGCAAESAPYELHITGDRFTTGADLHVRLVETDGTAIILGEWFAFERPVTYGVLEPDRSYKLFLYLDNDLDARCWTVHDDVWDLGLVDVQGAMTIDLELAGQAVDGCENFNR